MKILAINLGSTSTKLAVFEDTVPVSTVCLRHPKTELARYAGIMAQKDYRRSLMDEWLSANGHHPSQMDIIVSRCGPIRPMAGGTYLIDEAAIHDATDCRYGEHAANIGLLIADEWQRTFGIPAVFVDPPCTDELDTVARVSGYEGIARRSVFHALNAKRVIRLYCDKAGLDPLCSSFIVAHLGGGISVAAFENMRAIDVTNAIDGEGPFSPERSGSLPSAGLLKLVSRFEGNAKALHTALYRQGGLQSYFDTNDVAALIDRAQNEPAVRLVLDAMYYNIAKAIGAMATVLSGKAAQIILTGGMAHNADVTDSIKARVAFIAPVTIYPGEDELAALAQGAYRCITGLEQAGRLS
ncbi:MAG: butyrate kinase [Clostridiales bacterium]|nr:butyrate kinase [Clostridiales bacterium]